MFARVQNKSQNPNRRRDMSKRLIYGKQLTLKGDTIEFISTNAISIPSISTATIITDALTVTGNSTMVGDLAVDDIVCDDITCDDITCDVVACVTGTASGSYTSAQFSSTATGSVTYPREIDHPSIGPLVINGNSTQQGSSAYSSVHHPSTGALINADAVVVACKKFGHFIDLDIMPVGLTTPAVAGAASPITITAGVPVGYRPLSERWYPVMVEDNAVAVWGSVSLGTNGNITYYADATAAAFTNGANAAVYGAISVNYTTN